MFSSCWINRYNLTLWVYLNIISTDQILQSNCRRVVDAIPPDVNGVISFHQKIINLLTAYTLSTCCYCAVNTHTFCTNLSIYYTNTLSFSPYSIYIIEMYKKKWLSTRHHSFPHCQCRLVFVFPTTIVQRE